MRVTSTSYADGLISQLQKLSNRQSAIQLQISTGQRIQDASDDPLAAQRVLTLRDDSVANAQYAKNIATHQDFAHATQGSLQSLQKILDRVQEIAVSATGGVKSPDDLKNYGVEVGQLLKQAVQIANTQFRGEYIFSGTKIDVPAATASTDANGNIQSVTFGGNSTEPASEVAPGLSLSSRIPASNASGTGEVGLFSDARSGADIFAHLVNLQNQLLKGDTDGIHNSTADLKKDEDNLLYHVAGNGALQTRLETMASTNSDQKLAIEKDISSAADTDISQAIVHLSQQQTAYQATLQSAASVMNLSLLTYLR